MATGRRRRRHAEQCIFPWPKKGRPGLGGRLKIGLIPTSGGAAQEYHLKLDNNKQEQQ